eukprot:Nk52_evm26s221 gene=Nk52_evmTU26s221
MGDQEKKDWSHLTPEELAKKKEKEAKKKEKQLAKLEKFNKKKEAQKNQPKKPAKGEGKKKDIPKAEEPFVNKTPVGEKKDLSTPMANSYNSEAVEAAWYSWWEKEGFFKPEYSCGGDLKSVDKKQVYMLCIPPPNVTGVLHLGHALTNTIQDIVVRYQRMNGKTVLWNPGCDHAGIATQVVVEKKLFRDEGLSRHDIGREKFLERVHEWKDEKEKTIYEQIKAMGSSMDFDRAVFTMDPKMVRAVTEAFCRLHDDGLIYRSNRLVNWSPKLNSAISDLEVNHKELTGKTMLKVVGHGDNVYEFGTLMSFAYKIVDSDEEVVVATTRIETMLGDAAVAVHPDDARYKHLHGKFVLHPFTGEKLPIVVDDFVELDFGTSCVKITPAHDFNDYEVGKKHNLPMINILTDDGRMNERCGQFAGMMRFDARNAVVKALEEKGLFRGSKDNPMKVPICDRSGDVVEPMLKPQWWCDCKSMAKDSVDAVRNKELRIVPDMYEKTWFRWLENSRDWCVSRQLWWGHRIPAYLVVPNGKEGMVDSNDESNWVVARDITEANKKVLSKFGLKEGEYKLEQDPDVLDTWFSSGIFPFSIFGWPDVSDELEMFYPGSLLETGHDILFFWVARMVMMGKQLMGKLPFPEVLLHALVRDAHGRKMSKSLGNMVDPLDVIHGITLEALNAKLRSSNLNPAEIERATQSQKEDYPNGIPKCGTDALRFSLAAYALPGRDINLDVNRIIGYRLFLNKIWNATKFSFMHLGEGYKPNDAEGVSGNESLNDLWILSRIQYATTTVTESIEKYDFIAATTALYNLWLYDFCDVYLESVKPVFRADSSDPKAAKAQQTSRDVLYTFLENALRLIHPFMPFLSEELYSRLPKRPDNKVPSLCVAPFPKGNAALRNEKLEEEMTFVQQVCRSLRSIRQQYSLPNKATPEMFISCHDEDSKICCERWLDNITVLVNASRITVLLKEAVSADKGCAVQCVSDKCDVFVVVKGLVDAEKEIKKIDDKLEKVEELLKALNMTVSAADYNEKAPAKVKEANSKKMAAYESEKQNLHNARAMYASI